MVVHETAPGKAHTDKEADESQPAMSNGKGCVLHGAASGDGAERENVNDPAEGNAGRCMDIDNTGRGSGLKQRCAYEEPTQQQPHNGASDAPRDEQATHGVAASGFLETATPCEPLPPLDMGALNPSQDNVAGEAEHPNEPVEPVRKGRKRPRNAISSSSVPKRTAIADQGRGEPVGDNPKPGDPTPCNAVTPPGRRTHNGGKRKMEAAQPHGKDNYRRPRTNGTGPKVPELDTSHRHRCTVAADQGKGKLVGDNPIPGNPIPTSAVHAKGTTKSATGARKRKAPATQQQGNMSPWVAKARKSSTRADDNNASHEDDCDAASVTQSVKAIQSEPQAEAVNDHAQNGGAAGRTGTLCTARPTSHLSHPRRNMDGQPGRTLRCGTTETNLVHATGSAQKTIHVRAHSGRKSKQTAATLARAQRQPFQFLAAAASRDRRHATARKPQRRNGRMTGCGAPPNEAHGHYPVCSSDETSRHVARGAVTRSEPPTHQSWTAKRGVKRSRAAADAHARVPEPVCKPAPDARLCGRGWHERWPPPGRAPRQSQMQSRQTSLRELFARRTVATTSPRLQGKGPEAAPFGG